ncbi:MAG: threonine/serine dehydratase [Desulfurococcaceae archaeon]
MFYLKDVYSARKRISKYVRRTPLVYSKKLSNLLGFNTYLKLENHQVTRAFKVRGGVNYVLSNEDEALKSGLITASTGNHAQSIAYAGSIIGAKVVVVMPHGVSRVKVDAVKDLGAEVIFYGKVFDEALDYALDLSKNKGMKFVHSVNESLLYPGVGTMHLEVLEDLPEVNVVINPIGGGSGASSGVIIYKTVNPKIKVIGVQAEGAPSVYLSIKEGKVVSTGEARTAAEGLATSRAYDFSFNILKGRIDDVVLVSDREIFRAVKLLVETEREIAEPAGAASLAAALKLKNTEDINVVLMVTGGNIDIPILSKLLQSQED